MRNYTLAVFGISVLLSGGCSGGGASGVPVTQASPACLSAVVSFFHGFP
jgi:hypothetical protein